MKKMINNKKSAFVGLIVLALVGFVIGTILVSNGIIFDTTGNFFIQLLIGSLGIILAIIGGIIGWLYLPF